MAFKTIRVQIYEALRAHFLEVLADPGWEFSGRNVGVEPSFAPETEDWISMRILVYGARPSIVPDTTLPDAKVFDHESTVRLQCAGARGYAWLDAMLSELDDPAGLQFYRDRGFSCETAGNGGISDASGILGSGEQLRGTVLVTVSCRAIQDRVITYADQISTSVDVGGLTFTAVEPAI